MACMSLKKEIKKEFYFDNSRFISWCCEPIGIDDNNPRWYYIQMNNSPAKVNIPSIRTHPPPSTATRLIPSLTNTSQTILILALTTSLASYSKNRSSQKSNLLTQYLQLFFLIACVLEISSLESWVKLKRHSKCTSIIMQIEITSQPTPKRHGSKELNLCQ